MTKDETLIAQRCGASYCNIVPSSDPKPDRPPAGQYVMAVFGQEPSTRQHYSFLMRHPLAPNWREQIIKAIQSKKREKA